MIERIIDAEYTAVKQEGTVPPCENSVVTVTGTYTYEFTLEDGDSLSDIPTTGLTVDSIAIDGDTTYEWDGTQWVNQSACDPFIPENQPKITLTLRIGKTVNGTFTPYNIFPLFMLNINQNQIAVMPSATHRLIGANSDGTPISHTITVPGGFAPIAFRVYGSNSPSEDTTKWTATSDGVQFTNQVRLIKLGNLETILFLGKASFSNGNTLSITYTE